jgi:hypothetical protein
MSGKMNFHAVNLNKIKNYVKSNVALQCNVLHAPRLAIQGAPGTGKSDIIREICEENNWVLSVKYLSNMSLEQITGIPCKVEHGSTAVWTKPELFNFDFPEYAPESYLPLLEEKFLLFLEKGGFQARISSLYSFTLIKNAVKKWEEKNGKMEKTLSIKTAMPLHVCNSFAAIQLGSYGVNMVQASCELGRNEMEELCAKSPLPVEVYVSGRPVLLGTRAFLPVEGKMEDSKGEVFLVEKEGVLTLILPEKILDIPVCKGAAGSFCDLRYISSGKEEKKARFNFDVSLA